MTAEPTQTRIQSIDALRGIVMIIMALDHIREFFHIGAMSFQPENLQLASAELFFTRWITHFCAPAFFLTAGAAAFFKLNRTQDKATLSRFLWTRGLWLILLELTVLRFAIFFSLTSSVVFLTILYALGGSMILLATLIYLPRWVLTTFSLGIIFLHNLIPVLAPDPGSLAWIRHLLFQPGFFTAGPVPIFVAYPVIPWAAVMMAGFCLGDLYLRSTEKRRRILAVLGLACISGFLILRGFNTYGDPSPWTTQFAGKTFLSFLNVTKYPPSLDFLLMTLGPVFLLLFWLDQKKFSGNNPFLVFGQTPLFYFLVHFYFIHLLLIPLSWIRYGSVAFLANPLPSLGGNAAKYPLDFGYPLSVVYIIWIITVASLYPLCRWYSAKKKRSQKGLLKYL